MLRDVAVANPLATVIIAESVVTLDPGPSLQGKRVLVVEDGPTLTHGGMTFGAGTVAARQEGPAELVDPRPFAKGSIADVFAAYPHLGHVLPAMGYSDADARGALGATIDAVDADVVVAGTPIDLARLLRHDQPGPPRPLRDPRRSGGRRSRTCSRRCSASSTGPASRSASGVR